MRVARFVCATLVAGALTLGPSTAFAQDTPQALRQEIDQLRRDFDTLKQQYGDRLTALETKLAAAEGQPPPAAAPPNAPQPPAAATQPSPNAPQPPTSPEPPAAAGQQPTAPVPAGAEGAGGPSGALPVYGAAATGSKVFNPDIAVIGDFLGAAGVNHSPDAPKSLEMHESEASF